MSKWNMFMSIVFHLFLFTVHKKQEHVHKYIFQTMNKSWYPPEKKTYDAISLKNHHNGTEWNKIYLNGFFIYLFIFECIKKFDSKTEREEKQ